MFLKFADAANTIIKNGADAVCNGTCNQKTTVITLFHSIANVLIYLIGAVAVIMIILGGLRYVTSNGDAKAAATGKDTILYAVIGLVVALASYAIVSFVVDHIK